MNDVDVIAESSSIRVRRETLLCRVCDMPIISYSRPRECTSRGTRGNRRYATSNALSSPRRSHWRYATCTASKGLSRGAVNVPALSRGRYTSNPTRATGRGQVFSRLVAKRRRRSLETAPIRWRLFPAIFFKAPSNVDACAFGSSFLFREKNGPKYSSWNVFGCESFVIKVWQSVVRKIVTDLL